VTLAVAIGASAATWSLLSAVLLNPLPVREPDRLFVIGTRMNAGPRGPQLFETHIYPFYPLIREASVFEGLAAGGVWSSSIEVNGEVEPRSVFFASHDYFDTLGVSMSLGREFSSDEDRHGASIVAVLSDRFWRSEFGGDAGIVGRVVSIAGQPATIIGVTPRAFRGLKLTEAPALYVPLHAAGYFGRGTVNWFAEADTGYSPTAWVRIVGRLRPGSSVDQALAQLKAVDERPLVLTSAAVSSLPEASRPEMIQFGRLLGGAVALLLLVGALSVGMLLLVRTEARRDEFAMCLAIGASRLRLAGGVALEGLLLALSGVVLALPVCILLYGGVRTFNLPGRVSLDLLDRSIDIPILAAAVGAGLAAASLIAVVAGVFSYSTRVADALRSRSGSTGRVRRRRARAALVIVQTAVAVVLVSGAGLFAKSLVQALRLNPGYETSQLVVGGIDLASHGYDAARADALYTSLETQLLRRPAIRNVAFSTFGSGMGATGRLRVDGVPRPVPSLTEFRLISERYFPTVGLRIVRGRNFSADDTRGAALVGIVSQSLGRFVGNGGDPVGHTIAEPFNAPGKPPTQIQIVGVVPDVIENVSRLEPLVLYQPISQGGAQLSRVINREIVIRSTDRAEAAIEDARDVLQALDARVRLDRPQTIDDALLEQLAPQHFGMLVLAALGVLAVLLTILGTAVLAESMAVLRRREMGIRAALGATSYQLGALVVIETLLLVGAGLIVGLGMSWLAANTIESFLFQVRPLDPMTLLLVTGLILILTLAVTVRPAIRVARVDLARVLREQ
jgi:predicted permease